MKALVLSATVVALALPTSTPHARAIATSDFHACVVASTDRSVHCWGRNNRRQLGVSGAMLYATPQVSGVNGTSFKASAVATGSQHTCAIVDHGEVQCWGTSELFQLGPESAPGQQLGGTAQPLLVDFNGASAGSGSPAIALDARRDFSCAVLANGAVACWGDNYYGQLGNGSKTADSVGIATPQFALAPGSASRDIGVGDKFACALSVTGIVRCWGQNNLGQLGIGESTTESLFARTVVGLDASTPETTAEAIAVGTSHACALVRGKPRCWGSNGFLELGVETDFLEAREPKVVAGIPAELVFESLEASDRATCALTRAGAAWCWGSSSSQSPNLPYARRIREAAPALAEALESAAEITLGSEHGCAILVSGAVGCWGLGIFGQLGFSPPPVPAQTLVPTEVVSMQATTYQRVLANGSRACALADDGALACWGDNPLGALGNGSLSTEQPAPEVVKQGIASAALGTAHMCITTTAGVYGCAGSDASGQLGNGAGGSTRSFGSFDVAAEAFIDIVAGDAHTCALTEARHVFCWGSNTSGELGLGEIGNRQIPTRIQGLDDVRGLAAGLYHTCALTFGGDVYCWGSNGDGQLGAVVIAGSKVPLLVTSGAQIERIVAGGNQTCYVGSTFGIRGVRCWGDNGAGQIGEDNGGTDRATPDGPVTIVAPNSAVTTGYRTTCLQRPINGVPRGSCTGDNFGKYGNGSASSSPVYAFTDAYDDAISVGIGLDFACAVRSNGSLWCSGSNAIGQLGIGAVPFVAEPTTIGGLTAFTDRLTASGFEDGE